MNRTRAVIYSRVSTDEQADRGFSLRDQEARLREHCARTGYDVAEHFQDDASAKTFERPAFRQLLPYLRRHPDVSKLLVVKWDRFSRDMTGALGMIETLRAMGVEVEAIEQPIDSDVPEQRVLLAVYLAVPDVENLRRAQNTIMGTRRALREGRWCNAAPYGYSNVRDDRGRPIIVPNDKAPLVLEAFELAAATGLSIAELRLRMRRKGMTLSRSQFYNMLRRHAYMGCILVPAWRGETEELVNGIHDPIVPAALWHRVQEVRFGARKPKHPKTRGGVRPELLLRGHLVCPACSTKQTRRTVTGSLSRGRHGTQYAYYHCHHCKGYRVRAEDTHASVSAFLRTLQIHPDVAMLYREIATDLAREQGKGSAARAEAARERIAEIEAKLLKADEKFLDGDLEADSYRRLKAKLTADRHEAEGELETAKRAADSSAQDLLQATDLMATLGNVWLRAMGTDDVIAAHDLVGSIVPEGIAFDGDSIRTPFGASVIDLFGPKTKDADPSGESASCSVAGAGFEPATFGL